MRDPQQEGVFQLKFSFFVQQKCVLIRYTHHYHHSNHFENLFPKAGVFSLREFLIKIHVILIIDGLIKRNTTSIYHTKLQVFSATAWVLLESFISHQNVSKTAFLLSLVVIFNHRCNPYYVIVTFSEIWWHDKWNWNKYSHLIVVLALRNAGWNLLLTRHVAIYSLHLTQ